MFQSRNLKRSLVAFKNIAKCNGACSHVSPVLTKQSSTDFSHQAHSNSYTSSSGWKSPILYAAGGALLLAGLKSHQDSKLAYAEEPDVAVSPDSLDDIVPVDIDTILEESPQPEAPQSLVKVVSENETVPVEVTEAVVEETVASTESEVVDEVVEEEPAKLPAFPEQVQYLLIGGGTASYSAMRAIRKRDVTAKVLIVTDEQIVPYMRPPLSKELWHTDDNDASRNLLFKQWNGKYKSILYDRSNFYCAPEELEAREEGGVALATGKKVVKLNARKNVATLDDGTEIVYDKCLVATGGVPRTLPVFASAPEDIQNRVTVFRKIQDYLNLDEVTNNVKSITVIGGGFLGSELSCALAFKGRQSNFQVNQIFKEKGNMSRVLPEYLTKWTTKKVKSEGVNVISESVVDQAQMDDGRVKLTLDNGQEVVTDHVVVAVGLDVDTQLAKSAGIEVDEKHGGYRVNTELQARSNIWVAGDASCFYDTKLGRRRVEHHDHAVVSGRLAGENMTGAQKSYYHQSMFWSDLGPDVGYEAIGVIDSSLKTVAVFSKVAAATDTPVGALNEGLREEAQLGSGEAAVALQEAPVTMPKKVPFDKEEFQKGVIFYLRNEVVVGVLLWNIFGRMPLARKIIREQQTYEDYGELAKHFQVYNDDDEE